jgi:hypothetical protein
MTWTRIGTAGRDWRQVIAVVAVGAYVDGSVAKDRLEQLVLSWKIEMAAAPFVRAATIS